MSAARALWLLLLVAALVAQARQVQVASSVVTEGAGAKATTAIGEISDDAIVAGEVVRDVVITGDVVTRTHSTHGDACTSIGSIGSIGRCASRPRHNFFSRVCTE